jgi:DNA-binding MarR family transcriptional regulator
MGTTAAALDHAAIASALDRLVLWARRSTPVRLSSTSATTLDTLDQDGPSRITTLAYREGVSQPAMTMLVRRLADQRLVQRVDDPADRRAALVSITSEGRRRLAEHRRARAATLQAVVAQLPADHQAALASALDALHALTDTVPTDREGRR